VAVPAPGGRCALVFSRGTACGGVPPDWAATGTRPGDIVIVSIHWGSNWGYHVDGDQVRFARRLIDGGVDLIHGHSPRGP
jgi:hypothetical protein